MSNLPLRKNRTYLVHDVVARWSFWLINKEKSVAHVSSVTGNGQRNVTSPCFPASRHDSDPATLVAMTITPTWDLFIIVFFGLVITYSFIIGKLEAVKIIISTYIAILAVEGIGNVIERLTGESTPVLSIIGVSLDDDILTAIKLVIFIALIVFIAVRSGLEIDYRKDPGGPVNVLLTGIFGFATAGLLLISLFIFVSDVALLDPNLETLETAEALMQKSRLMQIMLLNQDLWFSLPALILIAVGFVSNEGQEEE